MLSVAWAFAYARICHNDAKSRRCWTWELASIHKSAWRGRQGLIAYYNTSHQNTRLAFLLRMDIRKVFGQNMRRIRLGAGLSQAAVAASMGVDRAHVSSMERGQQNVTLLTMWQASQALKCQPAEFLDEKPSAATPSASAKAPRRRQTKR